MTAPLDVKLDYIGTRVTLLEKMTINVRKRQSFKIDMETKNMVKTLHVTWHLGSQEGEKVALDYHANYI